MTCLEFILKKYSGPIFGRKKKQKKDLYHELK